MHWKLTFNARTHRCPAVDFAGYPKRAVTAGDLASGAD
jgi:hypothetical protein